MIDNKAYSDLKQTESQYMIDTTKDRHDGHN
jgi:hypothetical protein